MKIVRQPIEVIAYFGIDKTIKVDRFRLETLDGEQRVADVKRTCNFREKKFKGKKVLIFDCMVEIDKEYRCEIRYVPVDGVWWLYKI